MLRERVANVAPLALAAASQRNEAAALVNNTSDDTTWKAWDNGPDGGPTVVTPQTPAWVTLTWPQEVTLSAAAAVWAGFGAAEVQVHRGPAGQHPREASERDWETVAASDRVDHQYPSTLGINGFAFPAARATRAVRLRMTAACPKAEGHLEGNTRGGKRVWLGELMALTPLGDAPLASVANKATAATAESPLKARISLPEAGWVTLVVEGADGVRVRNLVSETWFPAGEHEVPWDGTDDLQRDRDAARHGLHRIPASFVTPGSYKVRGLVRGKVDAKWDMAVYNAGNPPWETADKTGGWLTNHTPPQAALFVPAAASPAGQDTIFLGSAVSEGGAGLAWVDLDGKKLGGRGWVGGNWTAAPHLARDAGARAVAGDFAYVGSTWTRSASNDDRTQGELRLTALTAKGDRAVVKWPFTPLATREGADHGDDAWIGQLGGIAAHDGVLAASLTRLGRVVFFAAADGRPLGEVAANAPRGVAFDAGGRLLVLAGSTLERWTLARGKSMTAKKATLVRQGLSAPRGVTAGPDGRVFVSDGGDSHQVKIFDGGTGRLLRVIGRAGAPSVGPLDPLSLRNPHGMAVDSRGQLWVTENDFQPKRVSVWDPAGNLVRAFHGPGRYGGGGTLDLAEPTRFFYDGMEFRLDRATGQSEPVAVLHRPGGDDLSTLARAGEPETPLRREGRLYLSNSHSSNPTGGPASVALWRVDGRRTRPVAAVGRAADWGLLKSVEFRPRWPEGVDPAGEPHHNAAFFTWTDANDDGRVQPEETVLTKAEGGGFTVQADLSVTAARWNGRAVQLPVVGFTPGGAPQFGAPATLVEGVQNPASSGGDEVLVAGNGWTVLTVAPKPFAPESLGGALNGRPLWSYPSLWPGLHASHEAPVPERPGELVGTTRLLGGFVTPRGGDAGPLWAINGNMGTVYVFTVDGLFVATLFQDERTGKSWAMPVAERGMSLEGVTLHGENFWPTLTQEGDGGIVLVDGARTSLVRVEGLESVRRLPEQEIEVTPAALTEARAALLAREAARQRAHGTDTLRVALRREPPVVDGRLDDWKDAAWVDIDKSGVAAWFDSDSRPHDVTGAVAVADGRLFAAFRTDDPALLRNSGETPQALFKTGGALDIMLGTDAAADPARPRPAAGDLRLLVTKVGEKTVATLYRAVVPGTTEPVPFSSPWRTITLDRVEDVSGAVELAISREAGGKGSRASGVFELSVPLATLGLTPEAGMTLRGDIGILRGDGTRTMQRVYWSNKATAITSDVPSEAELTPQLWGKWRFEAEDAR